jgi:CHAD domain-containing protein
VARGTSAAPLKARRPKLGPETPAERAFVAVFRASLQQVAHNAAGAASGDDPEYLHQLRVGLRRLRATLRAFREIVPRACARPVLAPLRALAPALGEARDLDVFCARLERHVRAGGIRGGACEALSRCAEERRRAAQQRLRRGLSGKRFAHWLIAAQRWLERAPWRESSEVPAGAGRRRLAEQAKRSLKRMGRRLRRAGERLDWSDAAARHGFRIRLKRFRYACEFFRGALPGQRTAKLIGALKRLQDLLGELNDLGVAQRLLRELASDPALQSAAGRAARTRLRQCLAREASALQSQLAPAWREISRARPLR